jgi:hypothetical protein
VFLADVGPFWLWLRPPVRLTLEPPRLRVLPVTLRARLSVSLLSGGSAGSACAWLRGSAEVAVVQVICERCAGVDVGKDVIAVAVRLPGKRRGGRETGKRTYRAFYGVLREMAKWLGSQGVTQVAMEATGTYSMPVCCALMESGFGEVLVCSAGHVKNVPGRKSGLNDAEWLAQLLECGLLRGSFVPPADVKAVRSRAKTAQQRVSGIAGSVTCCGTPASRSTRSPPRSRRSRAGS